MIFIIVIVMASFYTKYKMKLYICDFCHDYNSVEMFVFKQQSSNTHRSDGFTVSTADREMHICNTCFAKKFVRPTHEKQEQIVTSFIGGIS